MPVVIADSLFVFIELPLPYSAQFARLAQAVLLHCLTSRAQLAYPSVPLFLAASFCFCSAQF